MPASTIASATSAAAVPGQVIFSGRKEFKATLREVAIGNYLCRSRGDYPEDSLIPGNARRFIVELIRKEQDGLYCRLILWLDPTESSNSLLEAAIVSSLLTTKDDITEVETYSFNGGFIYFYMA